MVSNAEALVCWGGVVLREYRLLVQLIRLEVRGCEGVGANCIWCGVLWCECAWSD